MSRFLVESHAENWGRVPTRFGRPGEMREVAEILDRWPGDDHCYFRVAADAGTGAVYVYRNEGGTWTESGRLETDDRSPADSVGLFNVNRGCNMSGGSLQVVSNRIVVFET